METFKALRADRHRIVAAVRNREALAEFEDVQVISFDAENANLALELPDALDGLAYFPGTITLRSFRALTDDDFRRDLEINARGLERKCGIDAYVQKVERWSASPARRKLGASLPRVTALLASLL